MKNIWGAVAVLALVVIGVFAFAKPGDRANDTDTTINSNSGPINTNTTGTSGTNIGASVGSQKVSFTVNAGNFYFRPNVLRVKQGDTVELTVKNDGGVHDLKIDEFNTSTATLTKTGEMQTITFVADKKGSFEYYCSIGQHRQNGMKGTLIVE